MAKVFLVEDIESAVVLAVFIDHEDAQLFADILPAPARVEERTLFYGQPPNRGFNK